MKKGSFSILSWLLLLITLAAPAMFLLFNNEVLGWVAYPLIFCLLAIETFLFNARRLLMDVLHQGPQERILLSENRSIRGYAIASIALYGALFITSQSVIYFCEGAASSLVLMSIAPMVAIHAANYALLSLISSQGNDRFDLSVRNSAKGSPFIQFINSQNSEVRRMSWIAERILIASVLSLSLLLLMFAPTYGVFDCVQYALCLISSMFIASLLSIGMISSDLVESLDPEKRLSLFALKWS